MFENDTRSPAQKQSDDAFAESILKLLIAALFLVVLPFLTLSALLGYLLLCAYRDKKEFGVGAVLFIAAALAIYLVGPPTEAVLDSTNHWVGFYQGALFTDFESSFISFYRWVYQLFHWTLAVRTYLKFVQLTRYVVYATIPAGLIAWTLLQSQKRWNVRPGLYYLFKKPIELWCLIPSDPTTEPWSKLMVFVLQCFFFSVLSFVLLPRIPGSYWTIHFLKLLSVLGFVLGLGALVACERKIQKVSPDVIPIDDDGTIFSPAILNHHVHVLGESGFGKTVFLLRLIEHHVRHGMGLIFIDLKADTDTVSHIVGLCERFGRTEDLKLFDCSRPELSLSYNVLLRGNPTEIKDKLVGSFTWENSYYKDAAQSFLLTIIRAFVFLRDRHSLNFTLEDLYQATLSSDSLVALQTELNSKGAPEALREDINQLAHYLRNRENFKELHGLRTQIKLLIDSEFGPLLTASTSGIDLFDCIQQHKIVYVLLDSQRYGESAQKLGKLILQDLKSASSKIIEEIPKDKRVPCAIVIDEFADLATEQFVGFLNRSRGSKLGIVVAHQEMSDLEILSPTIRDQVMGNTATTVSFLQKLPESAERLAAIAGTKSTVKSTKQLTHEGFFIKSPTYTGQESERAVEEFIIHPNVFKNLKVGECVIIGKYPSAWNKKIRIPPPQPIVIEQNIVREKLTALRLESLKQECPASLGLKQLTKAMYLKTAAPTKIEDTETTTAANQEKTESPSDPNF